MSYRIRAHDMEHSRLYDQVYTCRSGKLFNGVPFHSQRCPCLGDRSYGHLVFGNEIHGFAFLEFNSQNREHLSILHHRPV